eukprot:scaffold469_cov160-Amphora_coffeaeformis.AAC.4
MEAKNGGKEPELTQRAMENTKKKFRVCIFFFQKLDSKCAASRGSKKCILKDTLPRLATVPMSRLQID